MHLYLQLTRSLAVTLIWLYCNKLVLRYVRLRVSDPGQVSIPQPGIVTVNNKNILEYTIRICINCIYVIALPVCYEYFLLLLTYMYMIIYSIPYEHLRTALKMY